MNKPGSYDPGDKSQRGGEESLDSFEDRLAGIKHGCIMAGADPEALKLVIDDCLALEEEYHLTHH